MGKVQNQFFPGFEPPRECSWIFGSPRARRTPPTKRSRKRVEAALHGASRAWTMSPLGSAAAPNAFALVLDQIFPQSNVSQVILLAKGPVAARERLRRASCPSCSPPSFRKCAGAPSCSPTGRRFRTRCSSASSGKTRRRSASMPIEVKAIMRTQLQPSRRQRQLERISQSACGWKSTRTRRVPWASRSSGESRRPRARSTAAQHDRPIPRRRQVDRHRVAPAAGRARHAITDLAKRTYVPTASGRSIPLGQIAKIGFRCGRAGVLWREGQRLRRDRAG